MPGVLRANGVPWLVWLGRSGWLCEGCAASGEIADADTVTTFAHHLGDLKRSHAGCVTGAARAELLRRESVGEALNPDRVEG